MNEQVNLDQNRAEEINNEIIKEVKPVQVSKKKIILFVPVIALITLAVFTYISYGNKHKGEQKVGLISNLVSITDNEDKGVKEILSTYGGELKYSGGFKDSFSIASGVEHEKYFELDLSKSDVMEKLSNIVGMPASGMAYIFYKNLKEEKSNYTEIRSVIIFNDGTKSTFKYPTKELEIVSKKMDLVNKVVDLIKEKKFKEITSMISANVKYNKDEIISNMNKGEQIFGNAKGFMFGGFRFNTFDNNVELLHISGNILCDKQNHEFSIDIDQNSSKDELQNIQYKY